MSVEPGYGDSVQASTRAQGERYFRAILTDAQIKALEQAANDSDDRAAVEYGGEPSDVLAKAVHALQTAEVIVP